jgi:hypothetical protein
MKKIIPILLIFLIGCTKMEIEPIPQPKNDVDIFSLKESSISDGEEVMFKLTSDSLYVLKLVDAQTNQVLSKEKIKGIIGPNKIKVHTKSLPVGVLYLILDDLNKNEVKRTKIIIK